MTTPAPPTEARLRALRAAVRDKDTPLSLCMPTGVDYATYVEYRNMAGSVEYHEYLKRQAWFFYRVASVLYDVLEADGWQKWRQEHGQQAGK